MTVQLNLPLCVIEYNMSRKSQLFGGIKILSARRVTFASIILRIHKYWAISRPGASDMQKPE